MNCDYAKIDDPSKERFYYVGAHGIGIWGHTTDQWTKKEFPEDWEATVSSRNRGYEFGCWHSEVCPTGELGSQHLSVCAPVSQGSYELAEKSGWPYLGNTVAGGSPLVMTFESVDEMHSHLDQAHTAAQDALAVQGEFEIRERAGKKIDELMQREEAS